MSDACDKKHTLHKDSFEISKVEIDKMPEIQSTANLMKMEESQKLLKLNMNGRPESQCKKSAQKMTLNINMGRREDVCETPLIQTPNVTLNSPSCLNLTPLSPLMINQDALSFSQLEEDCLSECVVNTPRGELVEWD